MRRPVAIWLCFLILSGGCFASHGRGDAGGRGDAAVEAATFTEVYAIIAENCTQIGCHGTIDGIVPPAGMHLSTRAGAYASLVGVEGVCAGIRVVPGDRESSILWDKINPSPECGARMPWPGGMLTSAEIETIGSWIAAGARND